MFICQYFKYNPNPISPSLERTTKTVPYIAGKNMNVFLMDMCYFVKKNICCCFNLKINSRIYSP